MNTNEKIEYKIQIDRDVITTSHKCLTGSEILELADKKPVELYQLYQKLKGNKVEKVGYDQTVCFDDPGIEKFTTQKKSHTDGASEKFKVQIDRDTFDAPQKCMTGKEILVLANKAPYTDYQLYQKLKSNKVEKIAYDQTVCFDDPGIERFTTQKLKHQDGAKPRRDFQILSEDAAFLDAMGYNWECVVEVNLNYIILRGVSLPLGYNVDSADIAIRIDNGYPRTQLDMAFFCPKLSRLDNQSINNLSDIIIEGKTYQQWSRHRAQDNPWLEGIDNLATHIGFIEQWLEDEFKRKPNAIPA